MSSLEDKIENAVFALRSATIARQRAWDRLETARNELNEARMRLRALEDELHDAGIDVVVAQTAEGDRHYDLVKLKMQRDKEKTR